MSIHEHEEDIDVVSSPEPSPRPSSECRTSTPTFIRSPHHDQSSLSPAKTESTSSDHGKTNSSFTSFSINSILSRNETKKDDLIAGAFLPNEQSAAHDAAMLSR